MKYHLDSMLPLRAFSPRSGRARGFAAGGMTLEGGGDSGMAQWQIDAMQAENPAPAPAPAPAPEPQGSVTVESAPANAGGGGGGVDQNTLNQLYQQYLGRAPDASGSATWTGQDINSVIAGITGSQEYANRGGGGGGGGTTAPSSGSADLNALYQQYLGRAPDPSGMQTFAGWSTQDVVNAITGSPEYAARTSGGGGSSQPTDNTDVNALYQKYLNRNVDPTGAATWAGQSPEAIIAGITGSQEYQNLHPGAEPITPPVTPGDRATWEAVSYNLDPARPDEPVTYYKDPKSGNIYSSNDETAKIVATGQALNDKNIQALGVGQNDPAAAQQLYDLKAKDPAAYYDQVATKLKDQAFEQYWTNSGSTAAYDQLQTIKQVDPQAYYKNQLDFLGKQVGWQYGQNTSDRAAPVIDKIKQVAAEAQGAGVSYDQVNKIVNDAATSANIQNQQRIATLAEMGGTGFNFGKDVMPGVALVAVAAATVASGGMAGTVGATILGEAAAAAVGATATAAVGGAVIGASMGALNAAVYNGNIGQGAVKGAISGSIGGATNAALSDMVATTSGLVGDATVADIAAATKLTKEQVAGIIMNTAATTVAAAATGQINSNNFAQVVGTALASSAIGAYSEKVAKAIDENISNAAISAVKNVAQIATTTVLNGGSVQNAIISNIPSIINSAVSADMRDSGTKFDPYATENVGFTSGAVDRTLQQGLIDDYINQSADPIAAFNAQRNLTGNALDNIRYSTNTMLEQSMPKSDIIENLASIYNVDTKTAEGYYQNTVANNAFEKLAAKAEDPIALLNASKMLTGNTQENLKYIADEMKRQGLSKSEISSNLQDLYQIEKGKADAYTNQVLGNKGFVSTAEKYSDAFKEARDAGAKTFEWNGKQYTTQLAPPPSAKTEEEQKTPMQTLAQSMAPRTKSFQEAVDFAKSTAPIFDTTVKGLGDRLTDPNRAYPETFKKYADTTWQRINNAISPYIPSEAPTLETIKSKLPSFDAVQQSFMNFVDKQFAPNQPTILDATKEITDTLVDVAKIAPRLAQSTIINAGGDLLQSFSGVFLSPFGRENIVYNAGKAMSTFAESTLPPEIKTQISEVNQMVKDAPMGAKEVTALYAYVKNPWAFGYLAGTEAIQDIGILGASKMVGMIAQVSGTFEAYKASVAADMAFNFMESTFAGMGSTYDKLRAKGVDHDTAVTTATISGTLQGFTTMATQGVVDAALLKRLSGDVADFTGKGLAKIGVGAYASTYSYTFGNNLIEQKAVNPNKPFDFNQANTLAAQAAPLGAMSAINTVVISNFQSAKNEANTQKQDELLKLKAPDSESQYQEPPKLLTGPQAAPKLLPAPEQITAIREIQNQISQTIQDTGISPDMANAMAVKTIGSDLVSKINDNIVVDENRLDPNKVLGTDADGKPITFADVFGSLATDEPILETKTGSQSDAQHNETLAKEIKVKLHDLLGIDLGDNALVAQTQRVAETQTTEQGLPFKERPSIESLFPAFDLTSPETKTDTETELKTVTVPSTSTSVQTQPQTQTETKTEPKLLTPTATDTLLADALQLQPVTQTQPLLQPVNPTPTPVDIAVMDPMAPITTYPKPPQTPSGGKTPITVNPPEVTTTDITPNVPATPSTITTPKLPALTSTTTKKKKVINPPDLFADFAKGRRLGLPLEKLQQIINSNQPSNAIPMENYTNPLLKPKTLEEELKAAKEGGLMHLAVGGGTGGSSAGATPGSNIGIGPGDMAYSPVANFVKGSGTKPFLPESYNLEMFNYTPTPFNPETALKQILAAADGGIVHMAEGGEPVDPGPELRMKGAKFNYRTPFTALNNMVNAPHVYNQGGEVEGHNPEFFSEGGLNSMQHSYVKGEGDGTSDSVPAMLANGEFVIPADVVSALGNGSNDSGASVLDQFLKTIRAHKTRAGKKGLPPDSKGALGYLLEAKRKVKA